MRIEAGKHPATNHITDVLVNGVAIQRGRQEGQAGGGEPHADPLPAGDLDSEQRVGHHREQDHATGDHRLHQRDRRQRKSADMQTPGGERDRDAQDVDGRAEQGNRVVPRTQQLDLGRRPRAAELVEKASH